jgi:hypothetical protein
MMPAGSRRALCAAIVFLSLLESSRASTDARLPFGLAIENTASYKGAGQYDWTLYISGSNSDLAHVRNVEYVLPQAFQRISAQVQQSNRRQEHFAISSIGHPDLVVRQAFSVTVNVVIDGRTMTVPYSLRFEDARAGSDDAAITDTLQALESSLNAQPIDLSMAREIWSAVDGWRPFRQYKRYNLVFEISRIQVTTPRKASVSGILREDIQTKAGEFVRRLATPSPAVVTVSKSGNKWTIDEIK